MTVTRIHYLPVMRAAILLLVLLQMERIASQSCPRRCTCKPVGAQSEWLRAKCMGHLEEIGDIDVDSANVDLAQLDLSKNDIHAIEVNVFRNLTNLRRLDLSENKIDFIDEGSFNGLEVLESLDLSKNQITAIHVHAFDNLSNLKRLKLNGNGLVTLKEGTFEGLKSLKRINLSNNPWRCDCDLYWFANWIHDSPIRLNPPPKCSMPSDLKDQPVKKLRFSEDFRCQWMLPTIEIRPFQNQVVFAGDSITLKCRAPAVTEDKSATLNWLWYPNVTGTDAIDPNAYKDPQQSLSNINVENRYLSDSGIVDSSLTIIPVKEEHNGRWNCSLVSLNGNGSKAISVIVISDRTRYCPLSVTRNNKGVYAWPRTVVGWKAELPCEGSHLSGLTRVPLRASYQCNASGHWENLNTDSCPYVSHTTKVLEQFSKVNLSLTKGSLLETAKRFKNYTGNGGVKLTDPVEIHFITQTIENYLNFLTEEKELGGMLVDVIGAIMSLPKETLRTAEITFRSCTRLIKAVETITEFTPSIRSHEKNIALEEFRVKRDSFGGLTCTWYSAAASGGDSETRSLHCATNNRTVPIDAKDKRIEASIQLPASLLRYTRSTSLVAYRLMISAFSDGRLFPVLNNTTDTHGNTNMDIFTSVVGSKLIGTTIRNLSEPVYVMLKAPLHRYTGRRPKPVVWDERTNGSSGWTDDGCYLTNLLDELIVFHCNKLGYYGLLQEISHLDQYRIRLNGVKYKYLNSAIYIGSFFMIVCLTITSVTYIVCYASIAMPKKAKHCVVNTWFAMMFLSFLYSVGIRQTENERVCQGVGLTLHYLSLCCLLWMAVSASNMHKRFSRPELDTIRQDELTEQPIPKPLLGLYLVGWGIALIICGISGAINLREYAGYSHCFLTSGPALAALFVPAGILIAYLTIFYLLIGRVIRRTDANAQLSEGTQATENMDLELLEPNANPATADENSVQTLSSDMEEDTEHSQTKQLKGLIVTLILYLSSWTTAAGAVAKPLNPYVPFEETIFSTLYAIFASSLGVFVLFFYGIARDDVRTQWLKMRCWLRKRKNRCCRSRSVSDTNPAIPQHLVQNLVVEAPSSNSRATQASDTNSVSSSRCIDGSRFRDSTKIIDRTSALMPTTTKPGNVDLVVLHRRQYRSNNSVMTYTEQPSSACVEMFYNPHQSGVARKFFKRQRRQTKNNELGPRKQGDGGATSDGGSCVSVPRPVAKMKTNIERSILSSSAKVNNTNIHVEPNPISDPKNVNILSDSGGSVNEERNVPIRFVIGRENFVRGVKINNDSASRRDASDLPLDTISNLHKDAGTINTNLSDADTKTDEEKHLRNVSQQCSLEYSSGLDSIAQIAGERSNQTLSEICETLDTTNEDDLPFGEEFLEHDLTDDSREKLSFKKCMRCPRKSSSMYCLPADKNRGRSPKASYRCSLNDLSFANLKSTEYESAFDSNLRDCLEHSKSEKLDDNEKLDPSSFKTDDTPKNTACTPAFLSTHSLHDVSNLHMDERDGLLEESHLLSVKDPKDPSKRKVHSLVNVTSLASSYDDLSIDSKDVNDCTDLETETYIDDPATHSLVFKKETSV